MPARFGTGPAIRHTATSPAARLLPFHRRGLTHVLILGGATETRRAAALTVHAESALRSGSFVGVDCSSEEPRLCRALNAWMTDTNDSSDPSLMAAGRGTLYLDRIEALSPRTQRQLLAFVTHRASATTPIERRWGGRLICGSGADLESAAVDGGFLMPLFDCLDKARVALDERCQGGVA
jgi:DNA-binding NtrC family response regulator